MPLNKTVKLFWKIRELAYSSYTQIWFQDIEYYVYGSEFDVFNYYLQSAEYFCIDNRPYIEISSNKIYIEIRRKEKKPYRNYPGDYKDREELCITAKPNPRLTGKRTLYYDLTQQKF